MVPETFLKSMLTKTVEEWVAQVTRLAEFATTQPQPSYAAFVFGLRNRWTYFLRTLPDIAPFLELLERAISRSEIHQGTGASFKILTNR